jgi:eukaryotic-like serine/threonine-protein kinase
MDQQTIPMTAERWVQLKRIFEAAQSKPPAERAKAICALAKGDQELELAAKDLLAADESAGTFLQTPAANLHCPAAALHGPVVKTERLPSLTPSDVISKRFEILRFLNRGGMGEVYEAWDTELKDRIALKTIRSHIAQDSRIIERFKREVKQARGISHANVCRVYDLVCHPQTAGEQLWFLTMELLEGETLLERLRRDGPLKPSAALKLIEQIVAGLAAAHDLGIVHRDFKSSNVMLVETRPGHTRAVVTDFGLAFDVSAAREGPLEPAGQGTPAYMAPEQRRNARVGVAADQYALGVVICEVLTGVRPTRLDSSTEPARGCAVQIPQYPLQPRWRAVISRCLQADPKDRFPSVRDILPALRPRPHITVSQAGAMAGILIAVVSTAIFISNGNPSRLTALDQLTPATDLSEGPSLSRDGKVVAYSSDRAEAGNLDVWAQQLPAGRPTRLTTDSAEDKDPSTAPDGRSIVFRSERNGGGLYLINADGGGERFLVAKGRNPRFSPDGRSIAYWTGDDDPTIASGKLYVLALSGQDPVRLVTDFVDARLPVWSPDGRSILFSGCHTGRAMPACSEWWVASLDGHTVHNTGALSQLGADRIYPVRGIGGWYGNFVLFSGRQGLVTSVWRLKLSPRDLRPIGRPEQLTSGDARETDPSLAENGTLAFARLAGALHVWRLAHATDPANVLDSRVTEDAAIDVSPYVSQNGHWLAFSRGSGDYRDIWVKDLQSGSESKFLSSNLLTLSPIVDSSGEIVVFEERARTVPSIFAVHRNGPAKRLCTGCSDPTGWFDEGRTFFYREGLPSEIKLADLKTGKTRTVLSRSEASLGEANWSPESQSLLFTVSKGEGKQIFAVHLAKSTGSVAGKWTPITDSSEWSDRPRWSGDGKYIFYLSTRDGFSCIWGQRFDPATGKISGSPFAVRHYHNVRTSVGIVSRRSFNLSVAGDAIYLNVGEESSSVWTGFLNRQMEHSLPTWRP